MEAVGKGRVGAVVVAQAGPGSTLWVVWDWLPSLLSSTSHELDTAPYYLKLTPIVVEIFDIDTRLSKLRVQLRDLPPPGPIYHHGYEFNPPQRDVDMLSSEVPHRYVPIKSTRIYQLWSPEPIMIIIDAT